MAGRADANSFLPAASAELGAPHPSMEPAEAGRTVDFEQTVETLVDSLQKVCSPAFCFPARRSRPSHRSFRLQAELRPDPVQISALAQRLHAMGHSREPAAAAAVVQRVILSRFSAGSHGARRLRHGSDTALHGHTARPPSLPSGTAWLCPCVQCVSGCPVCAVAGVSLALALRSAEDLAGYVSAAISPSRAVRVAG
jgi:hypothetical protein